MKSGENALAAENEGRIRRVKCGNPAITKRQLQSAMVWYYKERKAVKPRTSVVKVNVKLKVKAAGMESSPSKPSLGSKKMEAKRTQNEHN
jgi:hypothetical protein